MEKFKGMPPPRTQRTSNVGKNHGASLYGCEAVTSSRIPWASSRGCRTVALRGIPWASSRGCKTCVQKVQHCRRWRLWAVQDLREMVTKHLEYCKRELKQWPEKLIFYRDGVSEGQFREVQRAEVTQVLLACKDVWPNRSTTITFILVQKRHHTRFFGIHGDPVQRSGKDGNVVEGSIPQSFPWRFSPPLFCE